MKTMKKLLSFALSLSLAVSLAVPALADEPPAAAPILSEEEFRDQYVADHPELYEAFDPDAYFAETYPWRDKEEYMNWRTKKPLRKTCGPTTSITTLTLARSMRRSETPMRFTLWTHTPPPTPESWRP